MAADEEQHGVLLDVERRERDVVGHAAATATGRDPHVRLREPERAERGPSDRRLMPQRRPDGRHHVHVRSGERCRRHWLEESAYQRREAVGKVQRSLRRGEIR